MPDNDFPILVAGRCTHCGAYVAPGDPHRCDNIKPAKTVPSVCETTLQTALKLTGGDRAKQHGDKRQNHQNIADLWNAQFGGRAVHIPAVSGEGVWKQVPFTAHDVAIMMCLLKIARLKSGSHNPDNYVDLAGYAGVAAECADHG